MLPTPQEIDAYCVRRFNAAPSSTVLRLRFIYRNLEVATGYVYSAFACRTGRSIPGYAIWGNEPDDCRRGYYEFLADAAHELGLPTPEYLDWG